MLLLSFALYVVSHVADLPLVLLPPSPGVTFYFENRHETASFLLVDDEGAAEGTSLHQFSHFVRCWRTGRERPIHPRLAEIVYAVARHYGNPTIDIISGYRARPYGAPHSKHFLGRALDIHVHGVTAREVSDWVWQNFRHVGVGYYPKQEFVHVDVRSDDIRWVDHSRHGESARARYLTRAAGELLPPDAPRLVYDRAARGTS